MLNNTSTCRHYRDKAGSLSCCIVLRGFLIYFNRDKERPDKPFVTINAKDIRDALSTFGKAHSILSSKIILLSSAPLNLVLTFCVALNLWRT